MIDSEESMQNQMAGRAEDNPKSETPELMKNGK
jgi:hypothetical protein